LQTALPHIQAGKLNAIVTTGPTRSRLLPQTLTLAELGHKNLTTTIWFGLLAPSAVPQPVLQAIEMATVKVQADAGYRGRLWAQGFDVSSEHGPEFARLITAETARWAEVIRATGFQAND
jgi:tripartite-type tricarboxylate transporter receptor subunit TctC